MLNKTASLATLISAGSLFYFWDKKDETSLIGIPRAASPFRQLKADSKQVKKVIANDKEDSFLFDRISRLNVWSITLISINHLLFSQTRKNV